MDQNFKKSEPASENVVAGIVGAFLFSLGGGLAWFLFNQIGIVASFSGLIGVVLAITGYRLFAKKESIKGIIISSVIAFLVLVLAWYLCIGKDIHDAYQEWYKSGDVDFTLTYSESLRAVPVFLKEPEIGWGYVKDLLIGLGFALIGSFGTIFTSIARIRNKKKMQSEDPSVSPSPQDSIEQIPESASPLRSAETEEKVHEYLKANAYGHEIIFRKVARVRDELVIDGMVYAEHVLEKVQFPYMMQVSYDGHLIEAGYGQGNVILVDGAVIEKKFRW